MGSQIMEATILGIDISKLKLDVSVGSNGKHFIVSNDEEGLTNLVSQIKKIGEVTVVMEATSGYEKELALTFADNGIKVGIISPKKVRDFARASGILAKTDKIDSQVIALFGEKMEIRLFQDNRNKKLDELLTRRRQIASMLRDERNRLQIASTEMKRDITEHIKWLTDKQKEIETLLSEKIKENSEWNELSVLISSIPGVGPVMTFTIITELTEIGKLNQKEISALVGVAPLNKDSGKHRGNRFIWGGRAQVREILYMCTISAISYNPVIKEFYDRLRKAGKQPKVAIVACMHKLLIIMNSIVKKRQLWSCP